jgi:hypothetical protein
MDKKQHMEECVPKMIAQGEDPDKAVAACSSIYDEDTEGEIVDLNLEEVVIAKVLNKPFRTPKGPKKFSVYVKNDKGNIVKVNFGDPNMSIKRDDPERRKSFRARHNCDNPGPKWKARYWSCKFWSKPSVTKLLAEENETETDYIFSSEEEALNFAAMIGLTGVFKHVASDGIMYWFPGKDLEEFKTWYEVEELLMEMNDAD